MARRINASKNAESIDGEKSVGVKNVGKKTSGGFKSDFLLIVVLIHINLVFHPLI